MELYLRAFKKLGEKNKTQQDIDQKVHFQRALEAEAMNEIVLEVNKALKTKNLFNLGHNWSSAQQIAKTTGADDVFEAELYMLLEKAGEKALIDKNKSLGVTLIGNLQGNVNITNFNNFTDTIVKNLINNIDESELSKFVRPSDLTNMPIFRSAKTDVTGYSKFIDVSTDIKPEWREFISIFQGANFSLKNYASTAKTEVIHLGNTNPFKAIYGVLTSLGFNEEESMHIYAHTRISYLLNHSVAKAPDGPSHIIHMRFTYELTGSGLYDQQGNKLDEVDFFIYNDPASENIYVKSVKEMIKNVYSYLDISKIGDPWHAGIVVPKISFNS